MPIMLHNGGILLDGGKIAIAAACCCGQPPTECVCTCADLQDVYDAAGTLDLSISLPACYGGTSPYEDTMSIDNTQIAGYESCIGWSAPRALLIDFGAGLIPRLICTGADVEVLFTDEDASANCTLGAQSNKVVNCTPGSFSVSVDVAIVPNPDVPLSPCPCSGDVMTVTITVTP